MRLTFISVGPDGPSENFWEHFTSYVKNSTPPIPLPPSSRPVIYRLAALSREVPQDIRGIVISTLRQKLDSTETWKLSRAGFLAGVQVLSLLSVSDELYSSDAALGSVLLWQRSGVGLRMALDIVSFIISPVTDGKGLHRDVSKQIVPIAQVHRRRRVWGCCIIFDRL